MGKEIELSERLLEFGVSIIKLTSMIRKSFVGKHISLQLLRSSTSVGANYEEACGAISKADFINKMHIVLKETKESLYWLRLIEKSSIHDSNLTLNLIDEAGQISKIISKSLITAKKNDK